jgi:hypothetical protein
MKKLGLTGKLTWEDHVNFVKSTHEEMSKLSPKQLQEYIDSKQSRRASVLLTFGTELDKMHTATDARTRLERAAADAKRR